MSYTQQFNVEDFPCHVPEFLLKAPWEDISWGNDAMPSFVNREKMLKVWVDFDRPEHRDFHNDESEKYGVSRLLDVEELTEDDGFLFTTDDEHELYDFIEAYAQPDAQYILAMAGATNSAAAMLETVQDYANHLKKLNAPITDCVDRIATLRQELTDIAETLKALPDMNSDVRLFRCYWGGGGYVEKIATRVIDWFTTDLGYEADDLVKIANLDVGQTLDLSDLSGTHTITRVA